MDIILKEDVAGLGYADDVVTVKPGYGRNYLIPRGLAIIASTANRKVLNENLKQAAHKALQIKEKAQQVADSMDNLALIIEAKAGESGKIFGAVTTLQISEALKEKGVEVDRKRISFKSDVKIIGEHSVHIDLHKEVKKELPFTVIAI